MEMPKTQDTKETLMFLALKHSLYHKNPRPVYFLGRNQTTPGLLVKENEFKI